MLCVVEAHGPLIGIARGVYNCGLLWSIVDDKKSAIQKLLSDPFGRQGPEVASDKITPAHTDSCVWRVHATVVVRQQLNEASELES